MEKLGFPNRITVELTNHCNVSCTFCVRQSMHMHMGMMEKSLYYKIIDEASEHLPVALVFFFRGESLLHPNFMEFLRYAKEKGIGPIQFATNAYAMTKEISDQIIEAGLDFISFSLDTLDADVYRKTRLEGDLRTSVENVLYMSRCCRERRRMGLSAPKLQVSTIEVEDYMEGQADFVEFWKQHVDIVRVYYEHDDNGRFRNPGVQEKLEREVPERQPCRKVFTDMLIYWDGQLALCNYDWRGELPGLNVSEMSLADAWNSMTYEEIRKSHKDNLFADDILCKECQHWRIDYVQGGILGKSYQGDLIG